MSARHVEDAGIGRIAAGGGASTVHTAWIPGARPNTAYTCYAVATDPVTGGTAISSSHTLTTGNGPDIGNTSYCIKSTTEVDITYTSEECSETDPDVLVPVPVASALEYAEAGPGVGTLQWHSLENTTPAGEYTFHLIDLKPNTEYVYRIIAAPDSGWDNSAASEYMWFATKLAPASVEILNMEDGGTVGPISDVVVRASDPAHRFSSHGVTKVQLLVDGQFVQSFDVTTGTDYVDYTFHAGSLNLANGLHWLEACATDDLWNESSKRIQVMVDGGSGQQAQALSVPQGGKSDPELPFPFALPRMVQVSISKSTGSVPRMCYRAGPRRFWEKGGAGSRGYLYIAYRNNGRVEHSHWDASSGRSWNYRIKNNTLPPGIWRTAKHWRAGGHVEGVPQIGQYDTTFDGKYGPYLIHPYPYGVSPWPPARERDAFHIHGNWGPPYGWHTVAGRREKFYYNSWGCIILHRADLLRLRSKWQTYVLGGAEHGRSSIGIPLRVEYYDRKIDP